MFRGAGLLTRAEVVRRLVGFEFFCRSLSCLYDRHMLPAPLQSARHLVLMLARSVRAVLDRTGFGHADHVLTCYAEVSFLRYVPI